jgi:hypothetical protein
MLNLENTSGTADLEHPLHSEASEGANTVALLTNFRESFA